VVGAVTPEGVAPERRKQAEVEHGRTIVGRAAAVWGQHGYAGQERVRRRSRLLVVLSGAAPGALVLELGCGTGEYTARLTGSGATIVAIDLSSDLLALARRRETPAPAAFVLGDAERLPFPDGAFDAVVGNAVLHHLSLAPALAEVRRVLRPNGRCAFTEPNMLNPQVAVQKNVPSIKRWLGDTPHETAFFAASVRRALVKARLQPERVEPFDFLHPALPSVAVPHVKQVERALESLPLISHLAGSLLIVACR
jgi:ubiquinone/menaquinone biosynthesis C-methylase UbiE